jgi:hypothetical protein
MPQKDGDAEQGDGPGMKDDSAYGAKHNHMGFCSGTWKHLIRNA